MNATARSAQPVLEPFYYLKNFELVLSTILVRYEDLLLTKESQFITAFLEAPQSSRALLARMVMRRGDLFKLSTLDYREIGDTSAAAELLIAAGWVTDRPLLDLEQLQSLLTKDELIRNLKLPRRYADWRKPALVSMLKAQYLDPRTFAEWCAESADS